VDIGYNNTKVRGRGGPDRNTTRLAYFLQRHLILPLELLKRSGRSGGGNKEGPRRRNAKRNGQKEKKTGFPLSTSSLCSLLLIPVPGLLFWPLPDCQS